MAYKDLASIAPYFDDFDDAKAFYSLLFNPGRAVQGRELTQIQSLLQNQVKSFANHIFKDNSIVVNANIHTSYDKHYLQIVDDGPATPSQDLQNLVLNTIISDGVGNTTAKVTHIDQTNFIIYFDYVSGKGFDDSVGSPTLLLVTDGADNITIATNSLGFATTASCDSGIVYTGGYFVIINEQEIIVDKAVNGFYRIGFDKVESVVTAGVDASLGDPANGTNNAAQPGADRYKIDLQLSSYIDGVDTIPATFIEFLVVDDRVVIKEVTKTSFGPILDLLASRTFDESGNYIVDPFRLVVEDHDTDPAKLTANLQPGKAFVLGYEVGSTLTTSLDINKSRNTAISTNNSLFAEYGQYIIIAFSDADSKFDMGFSGVGSSPAFNSGEVLELMDDVDGTGNVLGTVISTSFKRVSDELRLYVTDVNNIITSIGSAKSIRLAGQNWSANLHRPKGFTELLGDSTAPILEYSDFDVVKDLTNVTYQYDAMFNGISVNVSNEIVINGGASDEFGGVDFINFVQSRNTSTKAEFSTLSVAGAGTNTITITNSGTPFVFGDVYDISLRVIKTTATKRTKSIITPTEAATDTIVVPFADAKSVIYTLTQEDALPYTKIIQTNNFINSDINDAGYTTETPIIFFNGANGRDVTSVFKANGGAFDNGQREYYYGPAKISGVNSTAMLALTSGAGSTTYAIVYDYYDHSVGTSNKFFVASSYPNFDTIGTFTISDGSKTYNLSNAIDFRFKLSELNQTEQVPYQSSVLFSDVEYYLSRMDKIYVNKNGEFGIQEGISSTNPEVPNDVDNSITLYTLLLPAYTYDRTKIFVKELDHRRYTMRDIGDLDHRIGALENYVSLNLLEKSAADLVITDVNGLNMFKSGIFVDSFSNYITHAIDDPDYDLVISPNDGFGRGPFSTEYIELTANTTANVSEGANSVTVSYTENPVPLAENNLASDYININPFLFHQWNGDITLTPSVDKWVDTVQLPAIVNEITVKTPRTSTRLVDVGFDGEWGWWNTRWFGTPRQTTQPVQQPQPVAIATNTGIISRGNYSSRLLVSRNFRPTLKIF